MEAERFYSLHQNQHLLNHETAAELKSVVDKFPWFYLGWMLYLKNLKQIESPEFGAALKKVAVLTPNRKMLFNFIHADSQKKADKTEIENSADVLDEFETQENAGNPLIDNFLLSEPGALRTNQSNTENDEFENRNNIIEKSDAEDHELITETLANIYYQQKNYEKALAAYKKLSLKYPEKSIYFATQIEEIEKLKNTNS